MYLTHCAVGRVTHVGGDFIGLLVLGVFNASILRDKIRTDLKLNEGVSEVGRV